MFAQFLATYYLWVKLLLSRCDHIVERRRLTGLPRSVDSATIWPLPGSTVEENSPKIATKSEWELLLEPFLWLEAAKKCVLFCHCRVLRELSPWAVKRGMKPTPPAPPGLSEECIASSSDRFARHLADKIALCCQDLDFATIASIDPPYGHLLVLQWWILFILYCLLK